MNRIEEIITELRRLYDDNKYPFPYRDVFRLENDYPNHFRNLRQKNHIFAADLDSYFSFYSGLAHGGIRNLLNHKNRDNAKRWVQKTFAQRFRQYRFLNRVDMSKYPELQRYFIFASKCRSLIIELMFLVDK